MRNLVVIGFLLVSVQMFGQSGWKKNGLKVLPPICYGSEKTLRTSVPLRDDLILKLKSAGGTKTATIKVEYIGFSAEAQAAFQAAVDVWAQLIYSPVPIYIQAKWEALDNGVLGSCGPYTYYTDFLTAPYANKYYPVALVEKMLGEEVTDRSTPDMVASFNKNVSWYYGTDGKTSPSKYDLMSVVMHEIAHGLGFTGFFYASGTKGIYGDSSGVPAIYDLFIENGDGQKLIDKSVYKNNSAELYQAMTSNRLWFDTELAADHVHPAIYAPDPYDEGSSMYHLDEGTYPAGTVNSLMTPIANRGESVHDPGDYTMAILSEMGWKTILMKHDNLKDIELATEPRPVRLFVQSDYELVRSSVKLIYTNDTFATADTIEMAQSGNPEYFESAIPAGTTGDVSYYFCASDQMGRTFRLPGQAPENVFEYHVGPDQMAPVLAHDPVQYLFESNLSVKIRVSASDNIGIKSVKLEYSVNGGSFQQLALNHETGDVYAVVLSFPPGSLKDGDEVRYRIVAEDSSTMGNLSMLPESGYYSFSVVALHNPVDSYAANFDDSGLNDFINAGFSIYTAAKFDNNALQSQHPYPSPGVDNLEYNFTSLLKYPVILKSGGTMKFDEVVLVEPGEDGSVFGDDDFWDYVIVEGSKDNGASWLPLVDGYDSRAQDSWLASYNAGLKSNNSTTSGAKDMLVARTIDLLANGNFAVGDTILVRFRLFSDPYAHGWGWLIDNLKIQDGATSTESLALSPGNLLVYPNPATDLVTVNLQGAANFNSTRICLYDASGTKVFDQVYPVSGNRINQQISLQPFTAGLYLITLETENGHRISRKILKN
jgi:hypothetical protein